MGSEEEFLALVDNAFAKLEWVETEGPDPEASEFAEVAAFLKNSDSGQREDLLKKLVTVLAEMFSKEKEKHENQETDEFLVTCPGSTEVFSVGYRGFWLISLLELEEEHVTVTLESFKVGGLGPFCFLGVWGDQDELIRFSSHICRQQKPLDKICLNEVRCRSDKDGLAVVRMLQHCVEFELSHIFLYFEDSPLVAQFWKELAVELKKSPVKTLETPGRALIKADTEDLREIWKSCVLEKIEVGDQKITPGDDEGWQAIEEIVAKEIKFSEMIAGYLEKFLDRIKDGQGPTCPSGFPLKQVAEAKIHWCCNLCGTKYLMDYPWRCEQCDRADCQFDVDRRCMVKYGGVEPVESVAQRFAEETGLKLKFAMMWLEEAGVDYERALKEFEEAKAEGKINPEGFEEK